VLRGVFVEISPSGGQQYAIVAAGTLSPRIPGTVFNQLQIIGVGLRSGLEDGQLKFRYDGYRPPIATRGAVMTIVKVLPVANDPSTVVASFVRFDDDGFVVRLNDIRGTPLLQDRLEVAMLMVEVSEFGKLALV
jgi:hypothetical protein